MRILLIGPNGRLGTAVRDALTARGAPYKPLTELSYEDLQAGTADKLLGQVELVRQGITHVAHDGSFTVIELPARQRINAVSPTVFTEALDVYGSYFPGFLPVPLRDVAATYVRSIEGAETGRVYELGN